ncbi:MAG TPA: methylmalonyl-CoA mutase family protein [Bacteroidales bacterium]|nr:methylmalonyl-CoA mutase family protein [Bacteroidales bacterium]
MDEQTEKTKQELLFSDFSPISTDQWEAVIEKDLKGAEYERRLVWNTREGFKVQPYYRREDLENLSYLNIFPGNFPFVRGERINENNWFVRQNLPVDDIGKTNKKALAILMTGVDSLGFILDERKKPTIDEIEQLMENIYAQSVEVNFICGPQAPEVVRHYLELVKKYNRDLKSIHGSAGYDPIGRLIVGGNWYENEEKDFDTCAELVKATQHTPHFRTLAVHATHFKNAGSNIVQELAFALAYGAEYLTRLTGKGISIDTVAPNIKFNFAIGSNYFMEIAKIRAFRLLWAKVVNAYGPSNAEFTRTHIHSVTTRWNKTVYDAHVNLLRTTTEAMAAIIGGTNSLTVLPYDVVFQDTSEFSERIARNQQLLLKEESYLDKIVDPAAGSYYVENLTDSLIEASWKLFLEIDEAGGFIEAFRKGIIQQQIKTTAEKRDQDVATRREILVGTNQYPNFGEMINPDIDKQCFEPMDCSNAHAIVETLKPYRGAMAFEQLRSETDAYASKHHRPKVFMFTYGSLSMRRARSQFSGNFFACAGFEIIDNNGFKTIDSGIEALRKVKPEVVVICAADDDYPVIAPEINEKIGKETIVVVAGYPKDTIEELKAKGLKHFIHVKSNVLETLKEFQKQLGIK